MSSSQNNFIKTLSKQKSEQIPVYCTGYPQIGFIKNYLRKYTPHLKNKGIVLYEKDYSLIKQMGFDAISLWEFRKGEGGYTLDNQLRVDGWGRIYNEDWYTWDGVFKNDKIVQNWTHLTLPSEEKINNLKKFLKKNQKAMEFVISLPGLFEKTWQSMGFIYFAKSLKKNKAFIEDVIFFFSDYLKKLIPLFQKIEVRTFLVADDYGYKYREFISPKLWQSLFFHPYKEIIDMIHKQNQKIIIHSDGFISNLVQSFIDLQFDAIQSLEPTAGVDIFALFKKFKNQICFIGNLDITLLSFGSLQQVKAYVNKLIKKATESKSPLIVSPTHQITTHNKPENIKIMIETAQNFHI